MPSPRRHAIGGLCGHGAVRDSHWPARRTRRGEARIASQPRMARANNPLRGGKAARRRHSRNRRNCYGIPTAMQRLRHGGDRGSPGKRKRRRDVLACATLVAALHSAPRCPMAGRPGPDPLLGAKKPTRDKPPSTRNDPAALPSRALWRPCRPSAFRKCALRGGRAGRGPGPAPHFMHFWCHAAAETFPCQGPPSRRPARQPLAAPLCSGELKT